MSSLVRTNTVDFEEKLNLALALSASEAEQANCITNARRTSRQSAEHMSCTQEEDDYRLALALRMSDVLDQNTSPASNQQSVRNVRPVFGTNFLEPSSLIYLGVYSIWELPLFG